MACAFPRNVEAVTNKKTRRQQHPLTSALTYVGMGPTHSNIGSHSNGRCHSSNSIHYTFLIENLQVDYTEVTGHKWDAMPADEFVQMASNPGLVGDPLVDTQHFIGASKVRENV